MERMYYSAKSQLVHFRLDYCCWFAPVRIGLMITGYFNIIADVVCLIGIANDGFSPTITRVQEILIEDYVNKPVPVMAYVTELGFNVVLMCAIYRRDLILMNVFMYYTIMTVIMSFLVYSVVILAVPVQIQLAIIFSTMFQVYIILLVRSVMVAMRTEQKQYELPTIVMSSLLKDRVTPTISDPTNGQKLEVAIAEVPNTQEVQFIKVGQKQEEAKIKDIKNNDVTKDDKEIKKDVEVTIEPESKMSKEEKKKEEKRIKEEKKKEEKRIKEEKKKEEKALKDEKKKEKNLKDEKKKEDKKNKEEKKSKDIKDVEKGDNPSTSKDNKDIKEAWLQNVSEHPKEKL